jgi:hypothetical protein
MGNNQEQPLNAEPDHTLSGWTPVYTTHGHGRKTHVALVDANGIEGPSLCGVLERRPDLLWSMGDVHSLLEAEEWCGTDADGYGCAICKKKLLLKAKAHS